MGLVTQIVACGSADGDGQGAGAIAAENSPQAMRA